MKIKIVEGTLLHRSTDVITSQDSVGKVVGRDIALPVLQMPQMVALALGCSEEEIGLKFSIINTSLPNN